jgi:hypothetical protein
MSKLNLKKAMLSLSMVNAFHRPTCSPSSMNWVANTVSAALT